MILAVVIAFCVGAICGGLWVWNLMSEWAEERELELALEDVDERLQRGAR